MAMAWKFNNETPIYIQIMDEIKLRIAQGKLAAGDKVPSVRELAIMAGVNPNTMQKALSELEREGVLYSNRTAGRFVANETMDNPAVKQEMASKYVKSYVDDMRLIGFEDNAIVKQVEFYLAN